MAHTRTEKYGSKVEVGNKSELIVTPNIRVKRLGFKDLTISEENMEKLYRISKRTDMPDNFSWVIPDVLGNNH